MSTSTAKYEQLQKAEDLDQHMKRKRSWKYSVKTMMKGAAIFTLIAVLLALCSSIFVDGMSFVKLSYPIHASCKIDWKFGMNCSSVSEAIVSQMKLWQGPENCDNGGEKCLYELKFTNSTRITGTHSTPVKKYIDDISFDLTQDQAECKVFGFSTSETWYAYLDKGTNYCNLENLITGSGLDKTSGYSESTSDDVCTEYSSADCDIY